MTEFFAKMATVQDLMAWLVAIGYRIFAARSTGLRHVAQKGLATWAMVYDVRRPRAMRRVGILWVARLLASMLIAIERSCTDVRALECTSPLLHSNAAIRCDMRLTALLRLLSIMTQDVLSNLAAIASRRNTNLTLPTGTVVTRSRTTMLSTGHDFSADLATAPTVLVVGVETASCLGILAAKAGLSRPHHTARWTGPCMASDWAWMWTALW
jgi:hypothetical protein